MSRVEQLRKLAAASPADPLAHYGLGLEYIQLEHWDDAVAAFDAAIAIDADYSAAYYHLARAFIAQGNPQEAGTALTRGVAVATAQGDMKTVGEMQELKASLA